MPRCSRAWGQRRLPLARTSGDGSSPGLRAPPPPSLLSVAAPADVGEPVSSHGSGHRQRLDPPEASSEGAALGPALGQQEAEQPQQEPWALQRQPGGHFLQGPHLRAQEEAVAAPRCVPVSGSARGDSRGGGREGGNLWPETSRAGRRRGGSRQTPSPLLSAGGSRLRVRGRWAPRDEGRGGPVAPRLGPQSCRLGKAAACLPASPPRPKCRGRRVPAAQGLRCRSRQVSSGAGSPSGKAARMSRSEPCPSPHVSLSHSCFCLKDKQHTAGKPFHCLVSFASPFLSRWLGFGRRSLAIMQRSCSQLPGDFPVTKVRGNSIDCQLWECWSASQCVPSDRSVCSCPSASGPLHIYQQVLQAVLLWGRWPVVNREE